MGSGTSSKMFVTSFYLALFTLMSSVPLTVCYQQQLGTPSFNHHANTAQNRNDKSNMQHFEPPLSPPFPNGLCGGELITIASSEAFKKVSIANKVLLPPRHIKVWLPPGYKNELNRRYPVLYCHDGQNAIEDASSWTGSSWRMAGALTRLTERKMIGFAADHESKQHGFSSDETSTTTITPPIVVMIPSSDGDAFPGVRRRHLEYGDATNVFAQAHLDFVGLNLKPFIDGKFRTLRGPENTSAIGSSLGGQAALNLVLRHPTVFGSAACMSPCFQPGTIAATAAAGVADALRDKSIYIDNGGDVDDVKVPWFDPADHVTSEHWWNPGYFWLDTQLQPGIDAVRFAFDMMGVDYTYHRIPGARHNERAWAWRIDKPLMHLYGR